MSEPALWFTTDPPCKCGRPHATQSDLWRWQNAEAAGEVDFPNTKGSRPEPEWSRRLCWTTLVRDINGAIVSNHCMMKPVDPVTAMR